MKSVNKLIAALLLFVLGLAIVPAETFHHHHDETILCKEGQIHLETKRFECELCKFVLPSLIQNSEEQNFILSTTHYFYSIKDTPSGVTTFFDIPNYRGPPEIA